MGIVAAPRCYRIRLQAVKKGEAKERPGVVVHTKRNLGTAESSLPPTSACVE